MINRAHTALTGHTLADVAGRTDREVFAGLSTPEQIERYIANDRYALNLPAGQSLTVEEQTLAPDGSMRTFLTKKFPVYAQDEQLMGVATITSEITQLKLAEEEREKLQGQLVQARKMESVGRLAGGVAHDFNNMLAVIIGYTEIALEQVGSTHPLIAILREIEKAAEHSATLTRQLLAFTRKQTVVPEVLDLNQTVAGMLNMLRRLIREDIDLAWIPGKNLRPVKVDPSQIDQLLVNLCVNAKDAITGPGKIIIETGTAILDEAFCEGQSGVVPGEFVLLTVNDNGHGMDLGVVGKVFEPFFTTKDRGKGTGLGLATVYGIVKQNNGFIQVHSEPGMGTTIKIFLLPYSGKIEQKPKEGWMESAGPGGETILLVEDEPGVLEMTSAMLKLLGYKVLAAGGPGEAIRLALEGDEPIHLLITDVVMPEMNGKDLQKRVEEVRPGIKHLFMSGYANESLSKGRALEERTNFIGKPFSKKVLADKIRKVLTS
jgi:signal transduction histidine kinase/CheY-like chemotaxis protein